MRPTLTVLGIIALLSGVGWLDVYLWDHHYIVWWAILSVAGLLFAGLILLGIWLYATDEPIDPRQFESASPKPWAVNLRLPENDSR